MGTKDSANLARICREQALLASTREVRRVLDELAEHYERAAPPASLGSVGEAQERTGEELE